MRADVVQRTTPETGAGAAPLPFDTLAGRVGAPTKYRFPQGSSRSFLLRFKRADGNPQSITDATLAGWIKRSRFDAAADALVNLTARLSIYDDLAGLALVTFAPADTSGLDPFEPVEVQFRVTLADGTVLEHEEHAGPLVFCPLPGPGEVDEPPNDFVEAITDMSTFVRVLSELIGLTGGQSTKLDGLSAAALAAMDNGQIVELFFDGSISARFRLRGRNTPETEYAGNAGAAANPGGSVILCDNDADRCWELLGVAKNGIPCTWGNQTLKWHQALASGAGVGVALTPAQEADAFSLPT